MNLIEETNENFNYIINKILMEPNPDLKKYNLIVAGGFPLFAFQLSDQMNSKMFELKIKKYLHNTTRGRVSYMKDLFAIGYGASHSNTVNYITISTTGNATDFGDLTQAGRYQSGLSNSTRGVIHEAEYPSTVNLYSFVTIASTGNAQDFGDAITSGRVFEATGSSPPRGIFGSRGPGNLGKIEYVTIPTTGNGISFGDLVNSGGKGGGVSNGHGGL